MTLSHWKFWALLGAIILLVVAGGLWYQNRSLPVPATRVTQGPLIQQVVASGTYVPPEVAHLAAEVPGRVTRLWVQEGDRFQAGQTLISLSSDSQLAAVAEAEAALAQLASSTVPQAQDALADAEVTYQQTTRERQRREALYHKGFLPLETLEQARKAETSARLARDRLTIQARHPSTAQGDEALLRRKVDTARAALGKTILKAPFDGRVQQRNVAEGDTILAGKSLLDLQRDDPAEIRVPVDEKSSASLRIGQPVVLIADAHPGQALTARVTALAPALDTTQGTLEARIRLVSPEPDWLRPGMTLTASIETARRPQALVVPNAALVAIPQTSVETSVEPSAETSAAILRQVFRVRQQRVEAVTVRIGLRGDSASEILDRGKSATAGAIPPLAAGDVLLLEPQPVGSRVSPQLLSPANSVSTSPRHLVPENQATANQATTRPASNMLNNLPLPGTNSP